jgi:hypothetical protein
MMSFMPSAANEAIYNLYIPFRPIKNLHDYISMRKLKPLRVVGRRSNDSAPSGVFERAIKSAQVTIIEQAGDKQAHRARANQLYADVLSM